MVCIRAPRIIKTGPGVEVLAGAMASRRWSESATSWPPLSIPNSRATGAFTGSSSRPSRQPENNVSLDKDHPTILDASNPKWE